MRSLRRDRVPVPGFVSLQSGNTSGSDARGAKDRSAAYCTLLSGHASVRNTVALEDLDRCQPDNPDIEPESLPGQIFGIQNDFFRNRQLVDH